MASIVAGVQGITREGQTEAVDLQITLIGIPPPSQLNFIEIGGRNYTPWLYINNP